MATDTLDPAEFGLNPADLEIDQRRQLVPEIARMERRGAERATAADFPFSYGDAPELDQTGLDVRMSHLLKAGEDVPGKREQLSAYRDYRRKRGEAPFAYLDIAQRRDEFRTFREQLPVFETMFSGPARFPEAFPEGERQAIQEMFDGSLNPEADIRQTANKMLYQAMTGQEPDEELWPIERTFYAREKLGWGGVSRMLGGDGAESTAPATISDEAFYQLAGQSLNRERADADLADKISSLAQYNAIQTRPMEAAAAEAKKLAGDRWKEFEPVFRTAYASVLADYSDEELAAGRTLFEAVAKIEKKDVERLALPSEAEFAGAEGLDALFAVKGKEREAIDRAMVTYGNASQADRDKILSLIARQAAQEGEDVEAYFSRVGKAFQSGMEGLTAGADSFVGRQLSKLVDEPETSQDAEQVASIEGRTAFLQDLRTAGVRVSKYHDGEMERGWEWLADASVLAAESLPLMFHAAAPAGRGIPVIISSYGERNIANLRRENPEADPSLIEAVGYTAGALEAGIDRLQWFTLGARLPKLKAAVLQLGKPGAALDLAGKALVVGGAEMGQEVLQDLTAPAITEIASALTQDIKGPDWQEVLEREKEALGEIASVSLLFGIIGATGSSISDHMDAPRIKAALSDKPGLLLAGYDTATVDKIVQTAQANPLAAAEMVKVATLETPVEVRKANSEAAREQIEAEAATDTAREAGLPTLEKLDDGRIQVNYPDRAAEVVAGSEEALDSLRSWEADTEVSATQAVRSYVDFLTEYHSSSAETAFRGETRQNLGTLADVARRNEALSRQAKARVQIAARQAGIEMGLDEVDLASIPIIGTSENRTARGITTIATRFAKDATPLTVIEESAEGIAKWLMDSGKVGSAKMIGWLREAEVKTGQRILADDFTGKDEAGQRQEIVEGWSYLAQANATGRIQDSALPSAVKSFFRAFKEVIHAALRIASDFLRVRGEMDPEFTYWLDVSAGVNEDFEKENLVRQMEAEMEAEAFDGMPEIGDTLQGRLPHPDTLAREAHPLVGEVRRIYDGLVQSGSSRSAGRRRANEFFLPPGEMADLDDVRERANRSGFSFETPGEMLDSLDLSVNYGKRQYGFGEAVGNQSFSISLKGKNPLADAIAAQVRDPEAKAKIYKRMMGLVADTRKRFDEKRVKGEFGRGGIDEARFAEVRDLATLEAVAKALPREIRGRFVGAFTDLTALKTPKGREDYMIRLLGGVEKALESHLQDLYRQAIRKTLKKGDVKVSEAKTRGGKISPHGHDVFAMAKKAMLITSDPADMKDGLTAAEKAEIEIERLTDQIEGVGDLSPERLDELDAMRAAIELFYDFPNADSARLERAANFLTETYQEGRKEWIETLSLRKEIRTARVDAFRRGVGAPEFIRRGDRRNDEAGYSASKLKALDEGIMAMALSGSQTLRRLSELTDSGAVKLLTEQMEIEAYSAEAAESDRNAADEAALSAVMREIFGTETQYGLAKKLHDYSDESRDAPVTTIEGRKTEVVSVPIRYAESLVEGETSGFERENGKREELDEADVAALAEAWNEFQELTEEEQAGKRVVTFNRTVAKGERLGIGKWSKFGGLQLWLTMRQPDQAAKLDRMGYDERTMRELEAWLPDDLKQLGLWMVNRIGEDAYTVDELHRSEKGVGLPLVDQYFPVRNRVARADNSGLALDGQPPQQGGRTVGFIKQRVVNQAEPAHVNALAVFLQHRAQSNFWVSHVAFMREWGGVIRDERFADAVRTKMGEKYYSALTTLFRRIESGGSLRATALNDLEKVTKGLTSRFAIATLGARVSTLMVNTTAVLNAAWEIPAADLLKGALRVVKRPDSFKDAWQSPAIQRRLRDGATFETTLAKRKGPGTRPILAILDHWARMGLRPINFVDTTANMAGAVAVWEYTRAAGVRAGLSEEEAKSAADRRTELVLLRAAQPQSRLARSEGEFMALESPLSALFTLFVSEPRKNAAITYLALRELATGKGTYGKKMALQQALVGLVLVAAAENLVRSFYQAWANAKDDEEDEVLQRWWARIYDPKAWGYKLMTQYLERIPLIGEAWNRAMAAAFDQKAFPASQNPLNQAIRSGEAVAKELMNDDPATSEERIELAIKSLQGFGPVVPGGPLAAQVGNVADFLEGVVESDEERLQRHKGRFNRFVRELNETLGKTTGPDGKIQKDVKARKDQAKADWIKANLTPLPEAERKQVMEMINTSKDVLKLVE